MKILFYRYGSICEPDIIHSFQELGNEVTEITVEIYNKSFTPAEGVSLLTDILFSHNYDFVFSINFYPFISEVCNIFKLRYIVGLLTVLLPNYILLQSIMNGIVFFFSIVINIIHFILIIQIVFSIYLLQVIQSAGHLSFPVQHLLTFHVFQVISAS